MQQASLYLNRLEEDLSTVDTVLKTGNMMVDAILNSKLTLIQERHIRTVATALVPEDIPISGIDLSVLIRNFLDNAMEACMQLPEEERFIRQRKRRPSDRTFPFGKTGTPGLRLLRIDGIAEKYNGCLNCQTENGVFATEVMLPLVQAPGTSRHTYRK